MKILLCSPKFPNVDDRISSAQMAVVDALKPEGSTFMQARPASGWTTSGDSHARMLHGILATRPADIYVFLDVDCIPLRRDALERAVDAAAGGRIYGHRSFSAHIDEGRHQFAGPDFLAFSRETYEKLGSPSLSPTARGDVAEELTWAAEEQGVPVQLVSPTGYLERAPWTGDSQAGFGTFYGMPDLDLSYHQFGAREAPEAHIRQFVRQCALTLGGL